MQPANATQVRFRAAPDGCAGLCRAGAARFHPAAALLFAACAEPFLASGGRHRFQPAENYLRALAPHGATSYFYTARQFLSEYPQRGLTIIVSDFLDDADCLRPLQYLADFGHELLLVQLWGREDREPSLDGEVELVDAESGNHLRMALDRAAREAYTEAFDGHCEQIKNLALRNGGRYTGSATNVPLAEVMFGALSPLQNTS